MGILIAILLVLIPSLAWGANGDITAARIASTEPGDGWVLEVDVSSDGGTPINVGGNYALGLGANNADLASAKIVLTVTSEGYDAAGGATTISRTLYGVNQLRKPYPDQAQANESLAAGVLTLRFALSEWVYDKDTPVTAVIGAGVYTQGGTATASWSGSVTNGSTQAYPKAIGRWAWPPYERVTGNFLVEMVGFHSSARNGKPLACVIFTATDESLNTVSVTTTAMSVSARTGDLGGGSVLVYAATIPVATLTQGETITVNFKAYPWVGDSGATLDSAVGADGTAQPNGLLGPLEVLNDKSGTYGLAFVLVDPAGADVSTWDAVGGPYVYDTQVAAEAANKPVRSIGRAITVLKDFNNDIYTRNEPGNGVILLKEASYSYSTDAPGSSTGTLKTWVTITRLSTAAKANVIISGGFVTSTKTSRIKVYDVSIISDTDTVIFTGSATTDAIWMDSCAIDFNKTGIVYLWASAYATRNTITNLANGFTASSQISPFSLVRGNLNNDTAYVRSDLYCVIGNSRIYPRYQPGTTNPSSNNSVFAFNKLLTLNVAPITLSEANTDSIAIVQNIFESTVFDASTRMSLGSSSDDENNKSLFWHNVVVGESVNFPYNDSGEDPLWSRHWSVVGNIASMYGNKQDTYGTGNGARIGRWSLANSVSYMGNVFGAHPFRVDWETIGIYGVESTNVATFVGNASTTTGDLTYSVIGGTGLGNGDYHIQAGSNGISLIPSGRSVLPYDFEGGARHNDGTGSAGAYEYDIPAGYGIIGVSFSGGVRLQ